jgi:hypothetical protein
MKINLGRIVIAHGITNLIESETLSKKQISDLIIKQMNCDWGETTGNDARVNSEAAKTKQGRILSAHTINKITIWVITDFGHGEYSTTTTVLLPSDY